MGGITANNGSETNDGIVFTGIGELFGDKGNFKATGNLLFTIVTCIRPA